MQDHFLEHLLLDQNLQETNITRRVVVPGFWDTMLPLHSVRVRVSVLGNVKLWAIRAQLNHTSVKDGFNTVAHDLLHQATYKIEDVQSQTLRSILDTMHYLESSYFFIDQQNDLAQFLGIQQSLKVLLHIQILSLYDEEDLALSQFSESQCS